MGLYSKKVQFNFIDCSDHAQPEPLSPLTASPCFYAVGFFVGATGMPVILGTLDGFAEAVRKGQAYFAAVPGILESGLGLLEINMTFCLLSIKDIPDAQLQASFFPKDLFGHGRRNLSHGADINLSFEACRPVPAGQFRTPPLAEIELVVEVGHPRGSAHIQVLPI